jgi:glucose/arabinose dehydrogenase
VNEILPGGKIRSVVPDGFNWPLGLAVEGDGLLWVADGPFLYTMRPGEKPEAKGMLFGPGYPGYVRGVAVESPGSVVVTSGNGSVVRYRPGSESETIAEGYQMLYGIALASDGTAVFADGLGGRVVSARGGTTEDLATGLEEPMGVALGSGGEVYVTENKGGRVIKIAGGRTDTVIDGLGQPQGIVVAGNSLFVLDALAKTVIEHDLSSGARSVIASDLPVGAPPGVVPKFMGPIGDLAGPTGPFAGLALAPDGTLYVSGDAEGSVLALRRA